MKLPISVSYAKRRKEEYPSIEEQLDILYHEGYDAWKAKIKEIKDAFPKPSSDVQPQRRLDAGEVDSGPGWSAVGQGWSETDGAGVAMGTLLGRAPACPGTTLGHDPPAKEVAFLRVLGYTTRYKTLCKYPVELTQRRIPPLII